MAMWVGGMVLVFLWIMGCGVTTRIIGVGLERSWECEGKMHGDITGLPQADAIVILGGGMGAHTKCGAPEMLGGADRVWQGARLYKAGLANRIFCTGGGCKNATVPLLMDFGVPREAIFCSEVPRNTEEEVAFIRKMVSENNKCPPKILLVTSAWHMTRAKMLFERVGFDVVPAPTDFEMSFILEFPIAIKDFFPWGDSFVRNSYALKEWVAQFGYKLFK